MCGKLAIIILQAIIPSILTYCITLLDKAQDVRPRLGMSDIPDAETYRESMDPLLLPLILKIFSNLSEHSIDAARVADPVLHYILMDFFAKSSRAEEIINGLNPSELFTTLKVCS